MAKTTQEEALLLEDIASLAAMINKHKAAQAPAVSSSYHRRPLLTTSIQGPPRFPNRSLHHFVPSTTPAINLPSPHNTVLLQQLAHTTPLTLVMPKPILPPVPAISLSPPNTLSTPTTTKTTPYIRRGNKLLRQSSKNSPHKKFILKSSPTPKSIPSSPSLRLKEFLASAATIHSPGFYRRHLFSKSTTKTTPLRPPSTLATYFRHGNSLVRKRSNKYIRPGVIIPDKKLQVSQQRTPKSKQMTIGGQVYVKTPRGRSLVRSKKSTAVFPSPNKLASTLPPLVAVERAIASNRVKRSLKLARTKKGQYCLFYSKFGKCNRKDTCRYIHDSDKVALCRKFLKGKCEDPNCLLQHKIDSERMPVCWHFLRGVCNKDNCPYLHVYVNEDAEPCLDFQNGYCPSGKNCKLKHIYVKRAKKGENKESGEKRKLEMEEEEEKAKRRKIEESELAKQIRPDFSAFFVSNSTIVGSTAVTKAE